LEDLESLAAYRPPPGEIGEVRAVVGEHRVDLIGNGSGQRPQEVAGNAAGRLLVQLVTGIGGMKKGSAGAPPLSGADWLLVNRQTTISEMTMLPQRAALSNTD